MDSKLSEGELNYDNEYNYYSEIPSYQMQTISSRLKIVEKDDEQRHSCVNKIVPFTVGTAFITHNVKLLKQETLQKLKTIILSYRNENEINSSNINELRHIKNDIDGFRFESQKLKYFSSRKNALLKAVTSRYKYYNDKQNQLHHRERWLSTKSNRRKEKINPLKSAAEDKKNLVDLLKLHNRLETLFRKNKSNTNVSIAQKRKNIPELEKPTKDIENFLKHKINNENSYSISNKSSVMSMNRQVPRSVKGKTMRENGITEMQDEKEWVGYNDEDLESVLDQKVKKRLIGDMTPMELTAHLAELQEDMGQKYFAPSIYSRKKRRRHIRKYIPTEVGVEDIQENDDSNLLNVDESKNSEPESDDCRSNKSRNNKGKWIKEASNERPLTQPVNG